MAQRKQKPSQGGQSDQSKAAEKAMRDNRSRQLDPQHDAYRKSRQHRSTDS